jgi:adenylate cyclase, class 2
MYEVELKFRLAEPVALVESLIARGAVPLPEIEQVDSYFNHPARDFAQTDEALRIRTTGGAAQVTYKGPVVDRRTKTRREIEVALADAGQAGAFSETLTALGFVAVLVVRKLRRPFDLEFAGRAFEVACDEVEGLGSFAEIETLASESDKEAAVDAVLQLAVLLGLSNPEPKAYLSLLLEKIAKKA